MQVAIQILSVLVTVILIFRFIRYLSTPLLKKIGFYKYYSPLFCTMPFFNGHLDIHLGTSWDFFKFRKINPRTILLYLAEGLYNLSIAIKTGKVDGQKILRGNIFYLKSTTFEKFGFTSRKLNLVEYILFVQNYIELCILKSISTGKLRLVSFKNVSIVTCKASELPKYSEKIFETVNLLKKIESNNKISEVKNISPKSVKQNLTELAVQD